MHSRISVNSICFPTSSIADDVKHWRTLKPHLVSAAGAKIKTEGRGPSIETLKGSGFKLATIVHPFMIGGQLDEEDAVEAAQRDMLDILEVAETLGSPTVYTLTGGRGGLTWEQAAERFSAAIAPCVVQARQAGIELLVEPAPVLYADLHIGHTLRDVVEIAEQADIGVCIDIFSCWTEAHLKETIERAAKRCHLVQVGDYVLGDRGPFPCRAVPGDGGIPLERIIGWILETGFDGAFDLEILGPRIDKEGHLDAVRRTCEHLSGILTRLGA